MARKYLVVVEKAEGSYSAYLPDIPGCVAVGDTPEEVVTNMREAVEFHLQSLIEDNIQVPESRSSAQYITVDV